MAAETLTLAVRTPGYRLTTDTVHHELGIDGFGSSASPGRPLLPQKTYLIALPPGAVVRSAAVTGTGLTPIPGSFRIEPAPVLEPLGEGDRFGALRERMQSEWKTNYDAVYTSDAAFPKSPGSLAGAGALRKYAYAAVSFCPFRYFPKTGALEFYSGATITVDYSLPDPGSDVARRQTLLMRDAAADKRAQRLFVNFSDVRGLYDISLGDPAPQHDTQVTADYVIITSPELIAAVNASDFISWKESLGFEVATILTTDIRIIARPGADLAEKTVTFFETNTRHGESKYVLIVGSPSAVPMRYCFADANNHVNNAGVPNASSGEVPADHYYADLSGPDATSWDLDGDGYYGEWGHDAPDFMAEVFVGRIPTIDPAKVTYTLDKLVRYEQDTGTWKHEALHAGAFAWFENEDYGGRELKDLATCIDSIETNCMGSWTIEHFSEQIGVQKSVYPWTPLSGVAFMNTWADGQFGVVNWVATGGPTAFMESTGAGTMVMVWPRRRIRRRSLSTGFLAPRRSSKMTTHRSSSRYPVWSVTRSQTRTATLASTC